MKFTCSLASNKFFDCCNGCEKRYLGCHDHCSDYLDKKLKVEAMKAKQQEEKDYNSWLYKNSSFGRYLDNPMKSKRKGRKAR